MIYFLKKSIHPVSNKKLHSDNFFITVVKLSEQLDSQNKERRLYL